MTGSQQLQVQARGVYPVGAEAGPSIGPGAGAAFATDKIEHAANFSNRKIDCGEWVQAVVFLGLHAHDMQGHICLYSMT